MALLYTTHATIPRKSVATRPWRQTVVIAGVIIDNRATRQESQTES
jgi:hypothetical protein